MNPLYRKHFKLIIFVIIFVLVSGCNAFKKQDSSQPNYKEMKQMVVDILQTQDGKKAIQDTLKDSQVKKKLVLENDDVKKMIQTELLSPDSKEKLKQLYEDPKFAQELAKILKDENKKLLKDLMKDPDYRKMMVEVLKDKEFEKNIMDIMKSNAYRNQMKIVMKEALDSPMFRYDILQLLEEASKKALEPEKGSKKSKDKGGQNDQENQK